MNPGEEHISYVFFGRAVQFQRAFGELKEPDYPPHDWPRYFMLCHAIELALKAYLALKGATYKQLKYDFGHNLTELLTEATKKGLSPTAPTHEAINALNEAHTEYWHRYPDIEGGPWSFPTIGQFAGAASELIQKVDKHLGP
jgi:HEPN domain-containing protein